MDKFKNKYRIQTHRKPNWDYSWDGLYFLTIVTQNRECNLCKIVDKKIQLSDFGKIIETEWHQSFEIRNELILHEYVIMPNHLHAIVEICNKNDAHPADNSISVQNGIPVQSRIDGTANIPNTRMIDGTANIPNTPMIDGSTNGHDTRMIHDSVNNPNTPMINDSGDGYNTPNDLEIKSIKRNSPMFLPKSISSFMAGFKSSVNTKIDDFIDEQQLPIPKYNRENHFFQLNYHDHIIRNDFEYKNISKYIINNPSNWNNDKFNG